MMVVTVTPLRKAGVSNYGPAASLPGPTSMAWIMATPEAAPSNWIAITPCCGRNVIDDQVERLA